MTVDLFHVYKERMLLDGIRAGYSVNYISLAHSQNVLIKRSAENKDDSFNLSGAESPREGSLGPTPSTGSEPPPHPPHSLKSDPKQLSRPSHEGETRDPGPGVPTFCDKKLSCGFCREKNIVCQ
jgi:hypothetical protein